MPNVTYTLPKYLRYYCVAVTVYPTGHKFLNCRLITSRIFDDRQSALDTDDIDQLERTRLDELIADWKVGMLVPVGLANAVGVPEILQVPASDTYLSVAAKLGLMFVNEAGRIPDLTGYKRYGK